MSAMTREELLARLAAVEQEKAQLHAQLAAQQAGVGGLASGKNVVAGGNMQDNVIITGNQNSYLGSVAGLTIQSAIFQAPPAPGQVDPKELLWTYLNQVVGDTGALDLSGVDRRMVSDQGEARLELAAVYTALDTVRTIARKGRRKERGEPSAAPVDHLEGAERERQAALAFAAAEPYAALLGDPGSGKTTFTNFLALSLAGELLGLTHANLSRLGAEWTVGPLLPVRVVLRSFAAHLAALGSGDDQIWRYLTQRLEQSVPGFAPLLNRHLMERGGLLILDGLDEVPEGAQQRDGVKTAILAWQRRFPRVRILLTSRTYAYQRQQWRLPGFSEAVLAPFTQEQIDAFVERWYAHLAQARAGLSAAEAQGRATLLKNAIARGAHLRELAPRPLLLTLMASLHAWRGSLPDAREQLYEESMELLLDIWERPKIVLDSDGQPLLQTESMAEWLRCPQPQVRDALEKLAYEVHAGQTTATGAADIEEGKLVTALLHAANDPDLKQARVLEYIRDRAGLLTNRGEGVYSFPHRTFQEYLAARHLTANGFPNFLVKLVRDDPERWREVFLLAGAKVARGTPYAAWSLVARLCGQRCETEQLQKAADSDWWAALLAGQLLVETGVYKRLDPQYDTNDLETLARVRSWLMALVGGGHLPPVDRATAGRTLGWLDDERPGVGVKNGAPDIDWVAVQAEPFIMGGDGPFDGRPQFTCCLLQQAYQISRYPITVTQYQLFVDAGGYDHAPYWQEAAEQGIWQGGQLRCHTWSVEQQESIEGWVQGPANYGSGFDAPNQPQIGISWYEALAFCRWLSEKLGNSVRLPTEAEWECAACHTDGRRYPWGDEFHARHCNMADTGIGSPSPVGSFPSGRAACGAADMSGNVWEWCSTKWRENYQDYAVQVDDAPTGDDRRVVRGGAFVYNDYYVRCAARFGYLPSIRYNVVGFRVVRVPGL
ncbi:MAG: NACHT domain-containing protein [Caldilinea sp. CFX5]|nr:NACHT domain-containing protein [Caldilinea sp. CFX5]